MAPIVRSDTLGVTKAYKTLQKTIISWHLCLKTSTHYCSNKQAGQSIALLALVLSVLIVLAVGTTEVLRLRRTMSRVQNSLDQAAIIALAQLDIETLAINQADLMPEYADKKFRATLQTHLRQVEYAITPDIETVVKHATLRLSKDGNCEALPKSSLSSGPALCASLRVTIQSVLGERVATFKTQAQDSQK